MRRLILLVTGIIGIQLACITYAATFSRWNGITIGRTAAGQIAGLNGKRFGNTSTGMLNKWNGFRTYSGSSVAAFANWTANADFASPDTTSISSTGSVNFAAPDNKFSAYVDTSISPASIISNSPNSNVSITTNYTSAGCDFGVGPDGSYSDAGSCENDGGSWVNGGSSYAMILYNNVLNPNKTFTISNKFVINSRTFAPLLQIVSNSSVPTLSNPGTLLITAYLVGAAGNTGSLAVEYRNSSGILYNYASDMWNTNASNGNGVGWSGTAGTYYVAQIISNSTQFSINIYASDGVTLLKSISPVNWSNLSISGNLYFMINTKNGTPVDALYYSTDIQTDMSIDYIKIK